MSRYVSLATSRGLKNSDAYASKRPRPTTSSHTNRPITTLYTKSRPQSPGLKEFERNRRQSTFVIKEKCITLKNKDASTKLAALSALMASSSRSTTTGAPARRLRTLSPRKRSGGARETGAGKRVRIGVCLSRVRPSAQKAPNSERSEALAAIVSPPNLRDVVPFHRYSSNLVESACRSRAQKLALLTKNCSK